MSAQAETLELTKTIPLRDAVAIGELADVATFGHADLNTLVQQANTGSLTPANTGELATILPVAEGAPASGETPLSPEAKQGFAAEIGAVGTAALGGENAAQHGRFSALALEAGAYMASWKVPEVRKAYFGLVKQGFIANERAGVNLLIATADYVPGAKPIVDGLAGKLDTILLPDVNGSASNRLNEGLQAVGKLSGKTIAGRFAPTAIQYGKDFGNIWGKSKEFRTAQLDAMAEYKEKQRVATQQPVSGTSTNRAERKGDVALAA